MIVPFLATQAWIRSLNYSIVDDWRQWHTNDQVAGYSKFLIVIVVIIFIYNDHYGNINGQVELIFVLLLCKCRYTRTYSNQMTFATVKVI
jgi:hypothetical protein